MTLMETVKNFWKNSSSERFLQKELIKSCLNVCKAVNNGSNVDMVDSFAYFDFISEQFRNKYKLNEKIYTQKHGLENVHIYGREFNS